MLKIENRNWKFGLHAFVLLINAFNFGPSFSIIVLYMYYVAFDSDKTFFLIRLLQFVYIQALSSATLGYPVHGSRLCLGLALRLVKA